MFRLSNGLMFSRLAVLFEGSVVGYITKSEDGSYSYIEKVRFTDAFHSIVMPLKVTSSSDEIQFFLSDFVVDKNRVDRRDYIPDWVCSDDDELYVTSGRFADNPIVSFKYE